MKVDRWIEQINDRTLRERILELRQRYDFLSKNLFREYEPTRRDSRRHQRDFMMRLEHWLDQFPSEEDKITAFRSVEYLFFAGEEEFLELFRCAKTTVQQWIAEINDLDPFDSESSVRAEIKRSWFCPITDSFRVNSFLHVTGLSGDEYRPDWLSMSQFADKEKICRYVKRKKVKYLVLLEDFVGSGKQARKVVNYAASAVNIRILVVPLIICAPGLKRLFELTSKLKNLSVKPIVVLPENCLVSPEGSVGEPLLFSSLRPVMRSHYQSLGRSTNGQEYGYGGVGSMVVTHSNCPNNTPTIYHRSRTGQTALFPRLPRPWSPG